MKAPPARSVPSASVNALYETRQQAGQVLGAAVARLVSCERPGRILVLGIARGGVAVAAEVARELDAELDVLVVRKIGAPGAPELGIGAVTADGVLVVLPEARHMRSVTPDYLHRTASHAIDRAREMEHALREGRPPPAVAGRTVVLVDDGLAMGSTAQAAVRSVSRLGPSRIVFAVPVGAQEACNRLRHDAGLLVCPVEVRNLLAISQSYGEFDQVETQEVIALLANARRRLATHMSLSEPAAA
jgi:putative phosphoribosyl transferase